MGISTSDAARLMVAARKRQQGTCPICGATFERLPKAIYCSTSCKLKAQYRRRKERQQDEARRLGIEREAENGV